MKTKSNENLSLYKNDGNKQMHPGIFFSQENWKRFGVLYKIEIEGPKGQS